MCMMRPMTGTRNSDGTQMYLPAGIATLGLMKDKKGVADFRQRHGDNEAAYAAMFGYDENVTKTLAQTEGREWDRYDPFGLKKPPTEAELKGTVTVTEPTTQPASIKPNPGPAAVAGGAKKKGAAALKMPGKGAVKITGKKSGLNIPT